MVTPMDKFKEIVSANSKNGPKINLNMPVSLQAIDTQSGAEFLMKHNGVLETNIIKMFRNNRRIRDALRAS